MDSRGHGGQCGSGGHTPDPVGSAPAAPGYLTRGILDPAAHYYRRLITDSVRAVDAVRELPGVDGRQVAAVANSQGGGWPSPSPASYRTSRRCRRACPFLCHVERALESDRRSPRSSWTATAAVTRQPLREGASTTHRDETAAGGPLSP